MSRKGPAKSDALEAAEMVELQSTITCPACGHAAVETMPTDACQYVYDCGRCGARLKPKTGDCCVFCSYGSVPCPPKQQERPDPGK
jgi:transcription elongation factor Elf1